MQSILQAILIGALAAGLLVLVVMGLRQWRRRRALAGTAHLARMRFSIGDPFDLPRRQKDLLVVSTGHSPRAENVIYGRRNGQYVRSFDFSFEAGHGPSRLSRRYSVIAIETELKLAEAALWNVDDAENAPLAARLATERLGPWLVVDGRDSAGVVADAFAEFGGEPVGIQVAAGVLTVCRAPPWPADLVVPWTDRLIAALGRLERGSAERDRPER